MPTSVIERDMPDARTLSRERYIKPCLWGLATLALLTGSPEAQSDPPKSSTGHLVAMMPHSLAWTPIPALPKGAKLAVLKGNPKEAEPLTMRLKFPPHYQVPPHFHPVTENVTVLSGTLHIGVGEKLDKSKVNKLTTNGFIPLPAGTPHYAWTTEEETIVQLHSDRGPFGITYVNPEDDPRK